MQTKKCVQCCMCHNEPAKYLRGGKKLCFTCYVGMALASHYKTCNQCQSVLPLLRILQGKSPSPATPPL